MGIPSRAFGPLLYLAVRASAYDLPEDFVSRIEPGLDAETKARLEAGRQALQRIRRAWRWTSVSLVSGIASLFGGLFIFSRIPLAGQVLSGIAFALLLAAAVLFVLIVLVAAQHRRAIHRLEVYARAMRGSSLARDLS